MSHLLFISHARGIHGAEAVMAQAIKACASAGARVTLVVPSVVPDGGMENALSGVNGLKIMALPYRAAGVNALRNALVRIYNLYALFRLAAFIKKEKIDVIYSSSSITILGAVLAKQTGVRHIWHWHEPVDKHFGWHPSMKSLYRRLAQRADTIVCISHTQQKEWEETLNLRLANARIVYNPIKPVEPVLSDKLMPHEEVKIGCQLLSMAVRRYRRSGQAVYTGDDIVTCTRSEYTTTDIRSGAVLSSDRYPRFALMAGNDAISGA